MSKYIEDYVKKQLNEVPKILDRQLSTRNHEKFHKRDDFKRIRERIDDYINNESDERFFVLPGLRGVGKTTLLLQSYEYLLKEKNVNPKNLLYISCEKINTIGQTDIGDVIECYCEMIHHTTPALLEEKIFVFIDEAHYDKNWALNGKILFDQCPNIFMMFTGSSSLHLNYNADAARRLKVQSVLPLNYSQHLKLKYNYETDISSDLIDLIFKGEIENACIKEEKIKNDLINIIDYDISDWQNYIKYGAFPATLNKKNSEDITSELWSIISKIITQDMTNVFDLHKNTQNNIYRVLTFLASQKPGEISQGKISNQMGLSKSTINSIFNILEKTQLIFHFEAFGGAGKRIKKQWKYYIATPSMKHSINEEFGITYSDSRNYDGILLENLIATSLYNLSNNEHMFKFATYYDSHKNSADFIVQKTFEKAIPIEVGLGEKPKKQVKKSMNNCGADYGILISGNKSLIEKKNDIIYISPETFSML